MMKVKMSKELDEFIVFMGSLMDKEYKSTKGRIIKEFDVLDNMVFNILNNDEIDTETKSEKILELVDNFKNATKMMIELKLKEIMEGKQEIITTKMVDITMGLNPNKAIQLITPMFEIVDASFDSYLDVCISYALGRLIALLKATREALLIQEICNEGEDGDILSFLKELLKELKDNCENAS